MRMRAVALLLLAVLVSFAPASQAKDEAQKLIKKLAKDKDPDVRAEAAWNLGQMGARDAVAALATALGDRDAGVRANAAAALWKLHEHAQEAVPALREALHDPDADVLRNVTGALRALEWEPAELVPVWKRLLDDVDCDNRVFAATALWGYVPPKDLFAVALQCQLDGDASVSSDAATLAGRILKKPDAELASAVLAALRNSRGPERSRYVHLLARFKPVPREAVPMLVKLLTDGEASNRQAALSTLGDAGEAAREAVPSIVERLLGDADPEVRAEAGEALGDLSSVAKEAIPSLIQALEKDTSPKVREAACYGLQEMRLLAKAAIPALNAALTDPEGGVRNAAERALMRVDPKH